MFEEVKTISWTCDVCGTEDITQNRWGKHLNKPEGWTSSKCKNPHSMFEDHKDLCGNCSEGIVQSKDKEYSMNGCSINWEGIAEMLNCTVEEVKQIKLKKI